MKYQNNWIKVIAIAVPLSLGLPVLLTSAATTSTVNLGRSQSPTQADLSESKLKLHAQDQKTCYQVIAEYGLYVREEPTVYSKALGILKYGQAVALSPGGTENWIPISAPIQGYVWADWLAPC